MEKEKLVILEPVKETKRHIDVNSIPKHTHYVIASATLDLIRGILAQPTGRKALDNKIAELGLC